MDHSKIFGVSEKEKKRIEDAERASKNEKLLSRLAKKRKEAEAANKDAANEEDSPSETERRTRSIRTNTRY